MFQRAQQRQEGRLRITYRETREGPGFPVVVHPDVVVPAPDRKDLPIGADGGAGSAPGLELQGSRFSQPCRCLLLRLLASALLLPQAQGKQGHLVVGTAGNRAFQRQRNAKRACDISRQLGCRRFKSWH